MQLQCSTRLKKWLKLFLALSNKPYDSWN
jgi:hypothetical protein